MTQKRNRPLSSAKRDGIIATAGALFVEHGYDAVSMDQIATAVPVSKPTLYNHFSNKEALYRAIMEERCTVMSETFGDIFKDDKDVRGALKKMATHFLDIVLNTESLGMYRVMIGEAGKFPELGEIFFAAGPTRIKAVLMEYLERQDKKGVLVVPNAEMSAHMLINMIKGNAQMKALLGVQKTLGPKARAEMIDYALDIFLKGHGFKA